MELSLKYKNLKEVHIKENLNFFSGKKFPLSIGIKSAKNEQLLLTDADCQPSSNQWIRNMQSQFVNGKEIVLGYGGYKTQKGLLNYLIRFETLHVAIQYLSCSLMNFTYMGVGRNLAYRKSLFYKNNGFISHYKVKSGDDDLFINQVANSKNATIEISKGSTTISEAHTSFSGWIRQKKRHFTTGKFYKPKHKIFLSIYSISQLLFFLSFAVLAAYSYNIIFLSSLFLFRILNQIFIFKKCMIRLDERKLLLISPILEILLIIINPLLMFSNMIIKQNKWK